MRMRFVLGPLVMSSLVFGCADDDDDDDGNEPRADAALQADAARQIDSGVADSRSAAVEVVNCQSVTPDQSVNMENLAFNPAQVTISAGQVVEWTNLDVDLHTVTSGRPGQPGAGDLFDSGLLNQSDVFCLRFNEAGAFEFYCTVHPDIMDDGIVTVQ